MMPKQFLGPNGWEKFLPRRIFCLMGLSSAHAAPTKTPVTDKFAQGSKRLDPDENAQQAFDNSFFKLCVPLRKAYSTANMQITTRWFHREHSSRHFSEIHEC